MNELYHYTSIETLYNMFEKSIFTDEDTKVRYLNMRATHIKYLNDETERKLFTTALKKAVVTYAEKQSISLNEEHKNRFKILCDFDSYIISLSKHQDDLTMWRGYGGNGVGVNIGFDFYSIESFYATSKPNQFKTENVYRPVKCKYELPDKYLEENPLLVEQVFNYLVAQESDEKKYWNSIIIMRDVQELATLYKHPAYKTEEEWRFVYGNSIPKYSFSNGIMKPYIDFPIPLQSISSVTIGPCIKSKYQIKSLHSFISDILSQEVEIRYSEIPYRH